MNKIGGMDATKYGEAKLAVTNLKKDGEVRKEVYKRKGKDKQDRNVGYD